jgi:hypothetical protein
MDRATYLIGLSERGQFFKDAFETLTEPEQTFMLVWVIDGEVMMNGWRTYFENIYSGYARSSVQALRQIGATAAADIAEHALGVFGSAGPPRDQTSRKLAVSKLTPSQVSFLDELTRRYIAYPDPIADLLYAYVQLHSTEIRGTQLRAGRGDRGA